MTNCNLSQMFESLWPRTNRNINIMEVCGTHTVAIFKSGIRSLLPDNIKLLSGPGCPVCVTPTSYIDLAVELSSIPDVIITTFGDMIRVPGSDSSLQQQKSIGSDVRVVYSPFDAVKIASENPSKKIVFLSVGFETTTPVIALAIISAATQHIKNFFVLTANKTIPTALEVLASDKDTHIDGFLYPGHVSTIIGTEVYKHIAQKYTIPGVVAGFEGTDIVQAIAMLLNIINSGTATVLNQYKRAVTDQGNITAIQKIHQVFTACDSVWRGIGTIKGSGLMLSQNYTDFDAYNEFNLKLKPSNEPKGCICASILTGKKTPAECVLFGKHCTPETPVGACMVSSEGTCAAHYKWDVRSVK